MRGEDWTTRDGSSASQYKFSFQLHFDEENRGHVADTLDIEQFVDDLIFELSVANADWPINNWMVALAGLWPRRTSMPDLTNCRLG